MMGLSTLAIWGQRSSQKLTEDTIDRLAEAQLAGTIASEQANISIDMGKMVLAKKATETPAEQNCWAMRRAATQHSKSFKPGRALPNPSRQAEKIATIAIKEKRHGERSHHCPRARWTIWASTQRVQPAPRQVEPESKGQRSLRFRAATGGGK